MTKHAEDEEPIGVGLLYKLKEEDHREVVPFYIERSTVRFAPVGSSREEELSFDEFRRLYELVKPVKNLLG